MALPDLDHCRHMLASKERIAHWSCVLDSLSLIAFDRSAVQALWLTYTIDVY